MISNLVIVNPGLRIETWGTRDDVAPAKGQNQRFRIKCSEIWLGELKR